jgi:DNA polymerase
MKAIKAILQDFDIDAIYGLDAETYYEHDSGYSLRNKNLGTTEYITSDLFKLHIMSVQRHDWKQPKVMTEAEFIAWARTIDWSRNAGLAHHAHFDGFICSYHYKIKPKHWFCTMSMAAPCMPIKVGTSLDAVDKAFGGTGKVGAEALENIRGVRELSKQLLTALKKYGGNDIVRTWAIFYKLLPYLPMHELHVIDETIRLYTDPRLLLDVPSLQKVRALDTANKLKLIRECGVPAEELSSGEKFSQHLIRLGVEPPMKVSVKKTTKARELDPNAPDVYVLATSKQDQDFKDLEGHENKAVRQLVAARFAIKSNQMENRCDRLISRAPLGPQPVYLKYWGAGPGRWSGGDLANWQNLSSKRKEGGAELRASVMAPPGYLLCIADLSQIEARLNAWDAGQADKLDVFRAYDLIIGWKTDPKTGEQEPIRSGPDIYRYTAAGVYNKPVDKVLPSERFIGKTCELALGYQAGWPRFAKTLRIGAFGPPVDISDQLVKDIHTAWRQTNAFQVANWRNTQNNIRSAFFGRQKITQGAFVYEGTKNNVGFIHGPTGMSMRYDDIQCDEDGMSYMSEYYPLKRGGARIERTKIYGGIAVQNKMEHLGRCLIASNLLELCEYMPKAKAVLSTHDELVFAVPARSAQKFLKAVKTVMATPPSWARDLPIAVDAHISNRYDK